MCRCFFLIPMFILITFLWYNTPVYVQHNTCTIEDIVKDPVRTRMEKAMVNMGPYYNYIISPEEELFINKGDGKWLTLKY